VLSVDNLRVYIHPTSAALAEAAAEEARDVIRAAIHSRGVAHAMFATGNSQLEFTDRLVSPSSEIPWHHVVVFHMDEYVGIDPSHEAGFAKWIRERIVDKVKPLRAHLIDARNDPVAECKRYSELLAEGGDPGGVVPAPAGERGTLPGYRIGASAGDHSDSARTASRRACDRRGTGSS
jgi:glucosamine-6-phosphate deaminase